MAFINKNLIPFILPLIWLLLWLSINAESYATAGNPIISTLHYLRFYLPSLAFFSGATAYLVYFGVPKINLNHTLLFLFIVGLISSTLLNERINEDLWLIWNMFCALGVLIISQNYVNKLVPEIREKSVYYLFIMTFCLFASLFLIYFGKDFLQAVTTGHALGYSIFDHSDAFAGMANIRATGISRTAVIVLLFCCTLVTTIKFKWPMYTLGIMTTFSLLFYQSRGSILLYLVLFTLIAINYRNQKQQLRFIVISSLVGISCFILYHFAFEATRLLFASTKNLSSTHWLVIFINEYFPQFSKNVGYETYRHTDMLRNTGGRLELWAKSLHLIKNNFILGYGIQADRHIISSGISLSNGFLYSFLSGGAIGGTFFFIWAAQIAIKSLLLHLTVSSNFIKKNYLIHFSSILSLMLVSRTFFENSISIFGLDYLLIISALFFSDYYRKNNITFNGKE